MSMTIDNVKSPPASDFPRLGRQKTRDLFDAAIDLKRQIVALEAKLAKLKTRLYMELEAALPDDVKSVVYDDDVLLTRAGGGEYKRMDTKWAKRRLLAKGVSAEEIDANSKVVTRSPSVRIQILGLGDGEGEED